jgi:hypothetical protein
MELVGLADLAMDNLVGVLKRGKVGSIQDNTLLERTDKQHALLGRLFLERFIRYAHLLDLAFKFGCLG